MPTFFLSGEYLQCPEEMKLTSWPAENFYNKLVTNCFVIDPTQRITFEDLVKIIEKEMSEREKLNYVEVTNKYHYDKETMLPSETHGSKESHFPDCGPVTNIFYEDERQFRAPTTNGYLRLPNNIMT